MSRWAHFRASTAIPVALRVPVIGFALLALFLLLAPVGAGADAPTEKTATPAEKTAPPDSWVGQLEALGQWVAKRPGALSCTERCFTLGRLRLGGSVSSGILKFELEGNVLAPGTYPVPLFGAPAWVMRALVVVPTHTAA